MAVEDCAYQNCKQHSGIIEPVEITSHISYNFLPAVFVTQSTHEQYVVSHPCVALYGYFLTSIFCPSLPSNHQLFQPDEFVIVACIISESIKCSFIFIQFSVRSSAHNIVLMQAGGQLCAPQPCASCPPDISTASLVSIYFSFFLPTCVLAKLSKIDST